jgi:CBS domain containing-hemolysin-like protein
MSVLVFSVFALLFVSAMASGTEAALFAVPISKVKAFLDEKKRGAKALQTIKDDMGRAITTVVIINNIANIVGSIAVGSLAAKHFGEMTLFGYIPGMTIFSGVLTFLVIAFSEVVPKTLGERHAERLSLLISPILLGLIKFFQPFIWVLEVVTSPFTRFEGSALAVTSEAEIKALTELGHRAGIIEAEESELIHNVFTLGDVDAADIMTPLAKVDYLQADQKLDEIRDQLATLTHTRLPVIDGTFEKLEGVVHLRNMLQGLAEGGGDKTVRDFAKEPTYIPSTASGDALLKHFQKTKQHLTIVVDGFGTMLGVLTLEDVLEVLVGDIVDETDLEIQEIEVISEDTVWVLAEADSIDVNESIFVNLPDMRVGELIIEELGRIPEVGEVFHLGTDAECTVISGTPRAIEKVQIRKIEIEEEIVNRQPSMETAIPDS